MACNVTEQNICRVRGDTTSFTVTVTSDGSTPIDITTFSFRLTVDPSPAPPDSVNNLFQIIPTITDGPNGVITVPVSAVNADQEPGTYFYDLQMVDGGGLVQTILTGEWQVVQDITKDPN